MRPFNAASWKELVKTHSVDAKLRRPASETQLVAAEKALGIRLPDLLREFLLESNGVNGEFGEGIIWSASEIKKRNQEFRAPVFHEIYMPFDHLLLFGEDAGGDQFAFAIHADGQIHKDDIYRWEHETDARAWFAGHLEQFIESRLKGDDEAELD